MREVLDRILSALNSLTFVKPDAAEILFADPQDGQSLVVAYSTNVADIGVRVDIGTSVCGQAFHDGRTVLLQRANESRLPAHQPGDAVRDGHPDHLRREQPVPDRRA